MITRDVLRRQKSSIIKQKTTTTTTATAVAIKRSRNCGRQSYLFCERESNEPAGELSLLQNSIAAVA